MLYDLGLMIYTPVSRETIIHLATNKSIQQGGEEQEGLRLRWRGALTATVSLTWISERGVSDAGILTVGEKERGQMKREQGQPHCLQSAGGWRKK